MTGSPSRTAVDRLKEQIAERIDADRARPREFRFSQRRLADHIGITKQTLNELLNGPSSRRGLLTHLDKIADYFGVTPTTLVQAGVLALHELTIEERRLVEHWRTLPFTVRDSAMGVMDYLSGLLPEEREERSIWQRWRQLGSRDRARLDRMLTDAATIARRSRLAATKSAVAQDHNVETETPTRTRHGRE